MAVSLLPRRLLVWYWRHFFPQKSKFHSIRPPGGKPCTLRNYERRNLGPVMYKINAATFYKGVSPSCNVSTYDSLVKQKSSGSDGKKCGESEEHPGRHKFHKEVEAALNEQIEMEFNASFAYLSMACYYGKSQVALPGCQGFFLKMHEEEHEHGIVFVNYVLMRGGQVQVPCIGPPDIQDWKDIPKTFLTAVQLESQVKEKLEELVELAEKHHDHQLVDFVSGSFLEDQNKSIQTLGRLLTRSKMTNCDIGEHLFDLHLYESFVKNHKDNFMYKTDLSEEENKRIYK